MPPLLQIERGAFDVDGYLAEERGKDLLRFSTAGSVDDGKSTLIGRLLYDTQSVYEDQVRSIEGKGTTVPGVLDLALLTDGLRAEREQGITIDVAYRYFSTARRKFIIADTPGHEQYTRNMATGASTSDVAIVLVDARKGVLPQSRRHAYITALLGVRHVLIAVNKMDLVGWSEATFDGVRAEFERFFEDLDPAVRGSAALHFVPVSALAGDNVVHASDAMPWYGGPTLLQLLEGIPALEGARAAAFRLPLQRVVRPNLDFRGYAGQIAAGTVHVGDAVLALPSGRRSRVERIVTFDGDLEEAVAPQSVTVTLTDEIDLSRGDLLVAPGEPATVATRFTASLVWMDSAPLELGRRYLLKQTSRTVTARVHSVRMAEGLAGGGQGQQLGMNGIALVSVETLMPICADTYSANRYTGSFILIDRESNATVAAGMIRAFDAVVVADTLGEAVLAEERAVRWGHGGAVLWVAGGVELVDALERALFVRGAFVLRLTGESAIAAADAGALVLVSKCAGLSMTVTWNGETRTMPLPEQSAEAVGEVLGFLREVGILRERGDGTLRDKEGA
jgi:sulfate adenylyltransferase subunit 1